MASLIQYATSDTDIRGVGVFIREIPPPGTIQSAAQNVVGFVGEFGWGPTDAAYEPTSSQDLIDTMFGPCGLAHAGFKAFYGKRYGRVICSRVTGSGAAAASVTIDDAASSGTESLVATAAYTGPGGNNITIVVSENADTATSPDVTVSFTKADGSTYTATYEAIQVSSGAVTDPGDPFVTFSAHASAAQGAYAGTYTLGMTPAGAASASTAGADGTINAASYTTAINRLGGASSAVAVVCPLEPTSAITTADVNGAIYTFSGSNTDKMCLLLTVDGETTSAAITDATSYARDNVVKCWPRVNQRLLNSSGSLVSTETDPNAFLASILANTDPWLSPGGKTGAPYTGEILSLEDETIGHDAYANLTEGGVCAWFMSSRNGAIIRGAVTTSLDTSLNRIRRRRYTTYLADSISGFLEDYVDLPLDIDLTNNRLGPNTTAQVGAIRQFLESERTDAHLIAFEVDPFEAMDATKYAAGRWDIVVRAQDVPGAEQIILRLQSGPSVTI